MFWRDNEVKYISKDKSNCKWNGRYIERWVIFVNIIIDVSKDDI